MKIKVIRPSRFVWEEHKIGLFSPSSHAVYDFPRRCRRSINALKQLGCEVKWGTHAEGSSGYLAASAEQRAADIYQLLEDPEVGMLMATSGGYNTNGMLPYLDIQRLVQNWKPLVGFSDLTALQLGVYAKGGLVSFYGPALLPQFGEFPVPHKYSVEALLRII